MIPIHFDGNDTNDSQTLDKHHNKMPSDTDDFSKSWTDDLPKCKNTGVGTSHQSSAWSTHSPTTDSNRNKIIDRCFNCEVDDKTCLYAIFSGHNGPKVAELAMQRIAAEIILGQLEGNKTDEEVREVLRQAFVCVEKCYQDSIDGILARRAMLQCNLMENTGNQEEIITLLQKIDQELSIGASAAMCLIYNSKLYICNVGTCRVLLCRNDENKAPRVIQFSVDHNLHNEDELIRLRHTGVDINKLKQYPIFSTRTIGYYIGKAGFKDSKYFADANAEPIVAQPEIVGGIPIDSSFQFLILISSGSCKYLEEIYSGDTAQENREIVKICAKEFQCQANLTDIAQAVVNKIIKEYYQASGIQKCEDDVTILLRNFHQKRTNQVTFNTLVEHINNTNKTETDGETSISESTGIQDSNSTTTISSVSDGPYRKPYDENQTIPPYVDFSSYFENVKKARDNGTLPAGIEFD